MLLGEFPDGAVWQGAGELVKVADHRELPRAWGEMRGFAACKPREEEDGEEEEWEGRDELLQVHRTKFSACVS